MTNLEFSALGQFLIEAKKAYYTTDKPLISDWLYDEKEWEYCKEAERRGIKKNELGEMDEDGKFFLKVGLITLQAE